jgi:hypothetical protein
MDPKAEDGSYVYLFQKSILQLLQRLKVLKEELLSMAAAAVPSMCGGFKLGYISLLKLSRARSSLWVVC